MMRRVVKLLLHDNEHGVDMTMVCSKKRTGSKVLLEFTHGDDFATTQAFGERRVVKRDDGEGGMAQIFQDVSWDIAWIMTAKDGSSSSQSLGLLGGGGKGNLARHGEESSRQRKARKTKRRKSERKGP